MLYAILIVAYTAVIAKFWSLWVVKQGFESESEVFNLYLSVPLIPAAGLALAVATIYILSKLGLVSGYFGMQ